MSQLMYQFAGIRLALDTYVEIWINGKNPITAQDIRNLISSLEMTAEAFEREEAKEKELSEHEE